jgi:ABC-type glycerol-3-phosphate transport system substrate-binding protein
LLESRAKVPDVYGIDVIWPGILGDNLLDLKDYVPQEEIAAHFPQLIKNNTVNGRLVALPHNLSEGLLFYRTDLVQKYGYTGPPKTWEELEKMAKRIQAGERAKGDQDFPIQIARSSKPPSTIRLPACIFLPESRQCPCSVTWWPPRGNRRSSFFSEL